MKTILFASLFLSLGASAGTVCFRTFTSFPVALEVNYQTTAGEAKTELFEFIPGQDLCRDYSSRSSSELLVRVIAPVKNCEQVLTTQRDYHLEIFDYGCALKRM